jgi:outer membrane receptor protein involved in Fe transport
MASLQYLSRWLGLLAICAILTFRVSVAGTTGKIAGKVTDAQTKEALIGANIVIEGTSLGAASDVNGEYFIINIPPGKYTVHTSMVGYAPVSVASVSVYADQTSRIDFDLESHSVQVNGVTVVASRPIVQKDLTSTTSTVTGDQISKLPVEDISSLVNLQAGVVDGHFRGGRAGEVKYLIDGVPVNDIFSGSSSMEPEVNSVQEVQVLSGTFNAEYGQALSGVVNVITKSPGDHYTGELSAYTGDYVSARTSLFPHIDHISPADLHNVDGSIGGPVPGIGNILRFYVSGRNIYDAGYLYGRRVFNPSDSSNFSANDPSQWYIGATGDGAYVPMNWDERSTLQGKLSINLGNAKSIILEGLYQKNDYRVYDHDFVLDPDGDYTYHQTSILESANYNHVLSDAAFIDLSASLNSTNYKQYVYENPLDPRYVNPDRLMDAGANAFYTGGTQNWHFSHITTSITLKADLTDQITQIHQIKSGIEVDMHHLQYNDFQIHVDAASGFKPALPSPGDFDYNVYDTHPYQFAAYVQDKIELDYLIVNAGVRFDYFQPDGEDINNPDSISVLDPLQPPFPDSLFHNASAKYQVSPRIGISYPISDRGAVHISYGHFFQIPPFEYLYKNPDFRIPLTGTFPDEIGNVLGNPDLQPQRTTMYEIGLQQEVADNLGVTITAYSKDIRNLLGVELHVKDNFKTYAEYVNQDYGAVKGVTISVDRRLTDGFGASLDYTYQIAQGDASDPNDDLNKAQASPPIEINKELVPLDWDRRHSLNCTLTLSRENSYTASLVMQLGSGLPYTPSFYDQRTGLENSDNMPYFFNTDLYVNKYVTIFDVEWVLFLKVYNLFDTPAEINVFTDTGRAGYTLELTRDQEAPRGDNTLQQYFTRPDFYSPPRQVVIGASLTF